MLRRLGVDLHSRELSRSWHSEPWPCSTPDHSPVSESPADRGVFRRAESCGVPGVVGQAADLRKFLRRHAKSNGIDAETLARMPIADPDGLQQLELPGPAAAALDRRVRACERLTRAASEHGLVLDAISAPVTIPVGRSACG
jgi:hypothetical protein